MLTRATSSGLLRRFGLWVVLILVVVMFSVLSSPFRSAINLENILQQNAIIGIVACGMTVMMITGGFDLSVGAVGATAATLGASVSAHRGTLLTVLVGLSIGLVVGTINGVLIAKVRINAFIATFAMASVVSGLLYVATSAQSEQGNTPLLGSLANSDVGPVPIAFIAFLVCLAIVWVVLRRTRYGHYVYSVGGNAEASHLSGVPVQRVQIFAFVLGGVFAAGAGLVLLGQANIGQPSAATTWPLDAIAICVVGGVALTGGVGRIEDVLAATLLLGVISNGLNQLNVSPYWQPTVTGLAILVAVVLDRYNRARSATSSGQARSGGALGPAGGPEGAATDALLSAGSSQQRSLNVS